ncbi:MAG TPA: S-methyl-5-thioribose-1-phosphate isomerase [Kofleriaceae bacterium]|nr:S-methyl-5-thioribose-1-phosphate isomerase [Kofleriaceae bacterium]
MKVEGRWRRTIEVEGDRSVTVLDQARLPYEIAWMRLVELGDAVRAIRDMHVRGAPLIGATAAYGVALAMRSDPSATGLAAACTALAATRPTAINLLWALGEMRAALDGAATGARADLAYAAASAIAEADVAQCEAIGRHGLGPLRAAAERAGSRPVRVLTHCNAGWLATVDWGTALAPIYVAHREGLRLHVWVDETRPRNQGMLTAWELAQEGVPHTVIADNQGGHLMQRGEVDLCIVGTDRTTRNGDVCNKIGTYLKALAARDNGVPFYAAVPSSSIDWRVAEPREIPIEERDGDELRFVRGRDAHGAPARVEVVPPGSPVANAAFDVTPHRLMTGLITERGIAPATREGLGALFPEHARP